MAKNILTTAIAKALPMTSKAKAPKKAEVKGPAKAAPVLSAPPAEAKVLVAWNHGKTVTHHAVRVGKATFTSTWKAFAGIPALASLSRGQHIKFRKALKKAPGGKLGYVHPATKEVYPFEIVSE